jgi:hypothetical protein
MYIGIGIFLFLLLCAFLYFNNINQPISNQNKINNNNY